MGSVEADFRVVRLECSRQIGYALLSQRLQLPAGRAYSRRFAQLTRERIDALCLLCFCFSEADLQDNIDEVKWVKAITRWNRQFDVAVLTRSGNPFLLTSIKEGKTFVDRRAYHGHGDCVRKFRVNAYA